MERVFLSFSFRPEDRELVRSVEAILQSHDLRPITGEVMGGSQLTSAIRQRIAHADAVVAVMTPTQPRTNGRYETHPWVRDEFMHARSIQKPAIAIVDTSIELDGMIDDDERIDLDPSRPLAAFVKLSQTVGGWKQEHGRSLKVRILPETVGRTIGAADASRCEYRFNQNGRSGPWKEAPLVREVGGTFAYLSGAKPDALIELRVQQRDAVWCSLATPQWLHLEVRKERAR